MADKDELRLIQLYKERQKDVRSTRSKRQSKVRSSPERVSSLLNGYFKNDVEAIRKIEETRAILAWPQWVGHSASRASQALRIRGTTLIVRVNDPIWMQQLCLFKGELLKKYRRSFPSLGLKDIFFTHT